MKITVDLVNRIITIEDKSQYDAENMLRKLLREVFKWEA